MTISEAASILGASTQWVYELVNAGRIRRVEGGRRGRGRHALVMAEDVERERLQRLEMLEGRVRRAKGE